MRSFSMPRLATSDQLQHAVAFGSIMTVLQAANFTHAKVPKCVVATIS